MPFASERMWIFEPFLPRSAGLRPVKDPPFSPERVLRPSIAADQLRSPSGAESVEDLSVQFVGHSGPDLGGEAATCRRDADPEGRWRCRQAQPLVVRR